MEVCWVFLHWLFSAVLIYFLNSQVLYFTYSPLQRLLDGMKAQENLQLALSAVARDWEQNTFFLAFIVYVSLVDKLQDTSFELELYRNY